MNKTSEIFGGSLPASNLTLISTAAAGTSDYISFKTGSQVEALKIDTSGNVRLLKPLVPNSSDGAALGSASLMWSDLFLASGAVINFNNGDVTVTHSANTLAFAGASSGYTFDSTINGVTLDANAWSTYTPTIAATSGTFTSVVGAGRYKKIGRVVFLQVNIVITTNGTAAGTITSTLPTNDVGGVTFCGAGRDSTSGKQLQVIVTGGNLLGIVNYDNTYPGADGHTLNFSITYESAA